MSGSDGNTAYARTRPLPDEDIDLAGMEVPEILRQVMVRLRYLEGDRPQVGELTNQLVALQQAQTTVQQSLNLIQAAHNALHERVGNGATGNPIGVFGGREGCEGERS